MLKTLVDQLTRQQREQLHAFGIPNSTISDWKSGKRTPTEVQVLALSVVCNVDRHALQDEVALMRATPEQRKLFERVLGKARGVVAGLLVLAASAGAVSAGLGSKAVGPFRRRRKVRQCAER